MPDQPIINEGQDCERQCERELDSFADSWLQCQSVADTSQKPGVAQRTLVTSQPRKQTSVRPFVGNVPWNTSSPPRPRLPIHHVAGCGRYRWFCGWQRLQIT